MKLILTSNGIQTKTGKKIIKKAIYQLLPNVDLSTKKVLVIHEDKVRKISSFIEYVVNNFVEVGFSRDNITIFENNYETDDTTEKISKLNINLNSYDFIYVGEGKIINLAWELWSDSLIKAIFKRVKEGTVYIGASAGAMLAGRDIVLCKYFNEDLDNMIPWDTPLDYSSQLAFGFLKDTAVVPHYSSSEFKLFNDNLPEKEKKRYKKFLSIPEGKTIVINEDDN